ncbi:MAG TPA: T9SS type B sorting domain-containing protein [Flavobacteriales bacterium]|nr:T9SS type B sorting domain-containing protein [Flavobacteriales bacterium]HIA12371.1 T9SS type B sorting domain-containing protein [Flavobacteriales bacterium]HIO71936.1 T9SS type B sorting domain-containing protein [Flavobacteriales bacterium]
MNKLIKPTHFSNILRFAFVIIISFMMLKPASATHVIGGEVYYECLDPATGFYRFTVKLYRDCYNGVPFFDDPIFVSVYDKNDNLVIKFNMALPPDDTLDNNTYNVCLYSPPDICVHEAVYQEDFFLPPGEFYMTYQRCCRNVIIQNIVNPSSVGFGFDIKIPDSTEALCNSSPYFNNYPPTIICLNEPFTYDHSATDPDGDSLVYYLCAPNDYSTGSLGIIPDPPGPPVVHFDVPYLGVYDSLYPIWAPVDSFKIDPVTGWMTGTPTLPGNYVVAVCATEYRDSVKLSTNKRDFQFNIAACLSDPLLGFTSEPDPCDNLKINFTYTGKPVESFFWDFGVDTIDSDTSIFKDPTYTYPDTGTYPVVLVVNQDYTCADTLSIDVTPPNPLRADFSWTKVCPWNTVFFQDQSDTNAYTGPITGWTWIYGDDDSSYIQNPSHIYADTITYATSLIITTANNCVDTGNLNVNFYPIPDVYAGSDVYITLGDDVELGAFGAATYNWSPPTALSSTTVYNPMASPFATTDYVVTGTSLNSCYNRDTVRVYVVDAQVEVPNAFSPNDDGVNDVIYLLAVGIIDVQEFKIFNRWGQVVFETSDILQGWDGMFNGQPQEMGNYAYYYKAMDRAGTLKEGSGDIALLR